MAKQTVSVQPRKAPHGEKMIEVRIRFFTNDIAEQRDHVLPKHAWDNGMVGMETNKTHDIKPAEPEIFNSFLEIQSTIVKVLRSHGIQLHATPKTKKLLGG